MPLSGHSVFLFMFRGLCSLIGMSGPTAWMKSASVLARMRPRSVISKIFFISSSSCWVCPCFPASISSCTVIFGWGFVCLRMRALLMASLRFSNRFASVLPHSLSTARGGIPGMQGIPPSVSASSQRPSLSPSIIVFVWMGWRLFWVSFSALATMVSAQDLAACPPQSCQAIHPFDVLSSRLSPACRGKYLAMCRTLVIPMVPPAARVLAVFSPTEVPPLPNFFLSSNPTRAFSFTASGI